MTTPEPPPHRRRRWQVSLRTIILLTAAVAVWLSYGLERRRIADLTTRIDALKPLARELVVDDPGKIAVVKQEELWYDENRWDVYLPAGRRYRVCLATREVDAGAPPAPKVTAPLESGRHVIALDQVKDGEDWRIDALCDQKVLASAKEPKDWQPGTGSMGGGLFAVSQQSAPDQPVVLYHRRFTGPRDAKGQSSVPKGPTAGIVLWIEPVADASSPIPQAIPKGP